MNLLRAVATVGAVLGAMTAKMASADEVFVFADEAVLDDAMATLGGLLANDAAPPTPCRIDFLNDLRGKTLFDPATLESMNLALAGSILGPDKVDDCTIESHEISQDDVDDFLQRQKATGDIGFAASLSYFKIGDKVSTLATLRGSDGRFLSSTTGLYELPVSPVAARDTTDRPKSDETDEASSSDRLLSTAGLSEDDAADAVPAAEQAPIAEAPKPSPVDLDPVAEASLRRQLAEEERIAASLSAPFNLRRIERGVPSPIATLRIVDAGGLDVAMMADLAESFLGGLGGFSAGSSNGSIERSVIGQDGRAGIRITVEDAPDPEISAIEIAPTDVPTAFSSVLDHEADIVVTREPISEDDAARFTRTYGVNMRSRYAEHVVAIGTGETEVDGCAIDYPRDDMLMITEDHPTSQRIFLYVNSSIPGAMRDRFVDFALSADGQAAVAEHAVDLRLQLSEADYAAWRYQVAGEQEAKLRDVREDFRGLIRTAQRVSSTFRFDYASADLVLDSRSEQDLENLIDLIKSRDVDSRSIHLFGFADSSGAAPYNASLSRDRADAVAIRLRLAGIPVPPRNVHGIGEDSPVACDVTEEGDRNELGARKNRRVEVWIES